MRLLNFIPCILLTCLLGCSKQKNEIIGAVEEVVQSETKADIGEVIVYGVSESDIISFITRQSTYRSVVDIEPLKKENSVFLYKVNYDDGWALFSADKRMPPVLAENPNGHFQLDYLDLPGVSDWANSVWATTQELSENQGSFSSNKYTEVWLGHPIESVPNNQMSEQENEEPSRFPEPCWSKVLISQQIDYNQLLSTRSPLLVTEWGQGDPWNKRFPYYLLSVPAHRFYTGCVPVAVSQLLYYHHTFSNCPTGLYHLITPTSQYHPADSIYTSPYYTLSLSKSSYTDPSSRWASMLKKYSDYIPYNSTSELAATYVSNLMLDVGERTNTHYKDSTASSTIDDAQSALLSFGLSSQKTSYNTSLIASNLRQFRPVFLCGTHTINNDNGHAWLVDGFKEYGNIITSEYQWFLGYPPVQFPPDGWATQEEANEAALAEGYEKPEDGMITHETTYDQQYYIFYMNWGWDGNANGYYASESGVLPDNTPFSFIYNKQMLYNIKKANAQ